MIARYWGAVVGFISQVLIFLNHTRKVITHRILLHGFRLDKAIELFYEKYILGYLFWLLSTVYFVCILATTLLWNDIFISKMLAKDGVTYFTSLAAMLGGVLAIVFSVSTLLMQNAAQSTSAGFYDLLAKDKWQDRIYWVISFLTVFFFLLALFFSSENIGDHLKFQLNMAKLSVVAVGGVLWLLYLLYRRIYERIKPHSSIKIIEDDVLSKINGIRKESERMAKILLLDPKNTNLNEDMALASSLIPLQPRLIPITASFDHLFDYHDKLLSLHERKMARTVLTSIHKLLSSYLRINSGTFFIMPSTEVMFANQSNAQKFLTPLLESLVSRGEGYIRSNDGVGITHIITIYTSLIIISGEIKYVSPSFSENPIFGQFLGYFGQLTDSALKYDNMEALFQTATRGGIIANAIIQNRLQLQTPTLFGILDKILLHALKKRHDVVWGAVVDSYSSILQKFILTSDSISQVDIRTLLKHIQNLVTLSILSGPTDILSIMKLGGVLENVPQALYGLVEQIDKETDSRKRDRHIHRFMEIVDENRRMLRAISEEIKTADHSIILSLANNMGNIAFLLLSISQDEKWKQEKEALLKSVSSYLYQADLFVHYAEKIRSNNSFDSIVNTVTKVGIAALDIDNEEVASMAIDILTRQAISMLTKESGDRFGFTEPRIMVNACYLGVYALKLGKKNLVEKLKLKIDEFEKAYGKVWFEGLPEGVVLSAPTREQLRNELGRIRDRVIRAEYDDHLMGLDLPEDRLVERIELRDVDVFTLEVWKFFVTPSPLDEEIDSNNEG